jgi:soluble lytic murein transglycosylase
VGLAYPVHMMTSLIKTGMLFAGVSGLAIGSGVGQEQLGWGRATQVLSGDAASNASLSSAIIQWKALQTTPGLPFETYAGFLIAHPGWPSELVLRRAAEKAMDAGNWSPGTAAAFFRRFPPLTNTSKARFAQALAATGARDEAVLAAHVAWISGALPPAEESAILTGFSSSFGQADQDARMDMLLWQGSTAAAQRQLSWTSPARRPLFEARLAFRVGAPDANERFVATQFAGANDPGYVADRAFYLRMHADTPGARALLAQPRSFTAPPADPGAWVAVLLTNARGAVADAQYTTAFEIARKVETAYPAGTDIGTRSYAERDDYTNLVWLAGQTALKQLARANEASAMFLRYAGASKSPAIQAKGLYWAGRAAETAGRRDQADGYYARAGGFRDVFYGQLSLERLGQPLVAPGDPIMRPVEAPVRAAFYGRETVRAAQYLGTVANWQDQTAFVRQIAADAKSDSDHVLADELSRTLGRPDLGVMVGRSALQNGLSDYSTLGFPSVRVPASANDSWTMIHAIARQESQFDRAAISHAGARGLMQLMPGTARDTATKLGMSYDMSALTSDTDYNITLGSTYFQRVYNQFGSYPLAVAAYNAGPGNVNKWLAANGDPRQGTADIIDWIEAIPLYETRNYVQRVLENAVVYDLMNPQHSRSNGNARLSWYLGKGRPG